MPQPADYIAAYAIIIAMSVFCICGFVAASIAIASKFVRLFRNRGNDERSVQTSTQRTVSGD